MVTKMLQGRATQPGGPGGATGGGRDLEGLADAWLLTRALCEAAGGRHERS